MKKLLGLWACLGILIGGVEWADASCVVDTSTPTYTNGAKLRDDFCDATGAKKTTGSGGGAGDASAANQTTMIARLDSILTAVGTTLAGYLDGVETLITSTNTKLDSVITGISTTLAGYLDGVEGLIGTTNTNIASTNTKLDTLISSVNTELPAAATLADATSNPTIPAVASFNMCFNGTTWDRCVKAVDPCQVNTKVHANINGTAGATIITGTASKKIYVCSLVLVTATAQNINLVSGTGTVCATSTAATLGFSGGTTAATGWNLSANGGLTLGSGGFSIGQTNVNADNLCMLTSSSGQITGGISYVVQ